MLGSRIEQKSLKVAMINELPATREMFGYPVRGVVGFWRGEFRYISGRDKLSYLAPLGSENISAPYFKQCFFRGGGITPQTVKHHASQSQDRNNKYFILYIEFCVNNKI